jgi:hypothetical protein
MRMPEALRVAAHGHGWFRLVERAYAGRRSERDDQGKALLWTVQGAINGTMKSWFGPSLGPSQSTGSA